MWGRFATGGGVVLRLELAPSLGGHTALNQFIQSLTKNPSAPPATLKSELLPGQEALQWSGTELPEAVNASRCQLVAWHRREIIFGSIRIFFRPAAEMRGRESEKEHRKQSKPWNASQRVPRSSKYARSPFKSSAAGYARRQVREAPAAANARALHRRGRSVFTTRRNKGDSSSVPFDPDPFGFPLRFPLGFPFG